MIKPIKKDGIIKVFLVSFLLFLVTLPVSAQNIWQGTGEQKRGGLKSCNQMEGGCDFCDALIVTSNIIQFLFQLAIAIAVLMMVWGGIQLMLAGGSEEKVSKGRKTITSAVIGATISLTSWLIVNTLLNLLASGSLNFPWNQITCS